jgi:hypothetical protein
MPSGFFLLSRFFLRVDNVLFRIYDVRLYRDFASGEILRETKGKEAPYDDVKNVSASVLTMIARTSNLNELCYRRDCLQKGRTILLR